MTTKLTKHWFKTVHDPTITGLNFNSKSGILSSCSWIFLTKISDLADDIALHYFKQASLKVEFKDNMTPVSAGDLAIETEIRKLVKDEGLDLSIIGEEYGETVADSDIKLIIDPIDSTKNIRGLPFFGSLFAIEEKGAIIAGMVSAPALHGRWWASQGQGLTTMVKRFLFPILTP